MPITRSRDLAEHFILKNPQDVNASGGYYVIPFVAALAERHFQVAQLLYRNGSSSAHLWIPKAIRDILHCIPLLATETSR
jgi:hypothetical protein